MHANDFLFHFLPATWCAIFQVLHFRSSHAIEAWQLKGQKSQADKAGRGIVSSLYWGPATARAENALFYTYLGFRKRFSRDTVNNDVI